MTECYLTAIVIHLKSPADEEGYWVLQGFPDSSEFSMYVLISMTMSNYNTLEMGGAHNADPLGQQVAPAAMRIEAMCVFTS